MNTPKILVADDDPRMIQLLRTVLRPLGVIVCDARDAFAALVSIRESPPDLAILDVNMPAGNGLSVCEMLATDCCLSRVPVIVLTGDPQDEIERRCRTMGAYYVLKNDSAMSQIKALVQDILHVNPQASAKSQFYIG